MGACSDISVVLPEDIKEEIMMSGLIFAVFLISLLFYLLHRFVTRPFNETKYETLRGSSIRLNEDEIPKNLSEAGEENMTNNTPDEEEEILKKRHPRTSRK